MVPIWSSATIAGLPLDKYPGWTNHVANEVFTRTKGSGAEVIKKKGGAGFAVGLAIQEVVETIALDRRRVLPVSSVLSGCYGLRDVAISVPTVVGRAVVGVARNRLWPKGCRRCGRARACCGKLVGVGVRVGGQECERGGGNRSERVVHP
jgi:L-lactate dehydrogenase